jgi:hypothetical protein
MPKASGEKHACLKFDWELVRLGEHAGYIHVKGILEMAAHHPDAPRETARKSLQEEAPRTLCHMARN